MLKRLVAGLGSGRQAARQGFALALTLVLQHTPAVTPEAAVTALEATLDVAGSKKVCCGSVVVEKTNHTCCQALSDTEASACLAGSRDQGCAVRPRLRLRSSDQVGQTHRLGQPGAFLVLCPLTVPCQPCNVCSAAGPAGALRAAARGAGCQAQLPPGVRS